MWNKYGHYASSCRSSIKRKHEASTAGVEKDPPHKEPRKDDRSEFFFDEMIQRSRL